MNKRSLAVVGTVVVLASFSLLAGCRHKTHIVRLLVHGSVVTGLIHEKTIILAPADPAHSLVGGYPNLEETISTACSAGAYEFTLKGIKPAEKKTGANGENGSTIDPAFAPITFTMPNWKPLGLPYFVTMDLPAATRIVALGPQYPVQFASGESDFVPLTQMLEFEVHDSDDVRLVRKCGQDEKEYRPLSCTEMRARYDKVFTQVPPDPHALKPTERNYIDFALKSCADDASYLFVGIGIDPRHGPSSEDHGIDFYNKKILPEIFGGADKVPADKKLVKNGHVTPNGGRGSDNGEVRLIKTSFDGEYPRYVPVLMIENCTSPAAFVHP